MGGKKEEEWNEEEAEDKEATFYYDIEMARVKGEHEERLFI